MVQQNCLIENIFILLVSDLNFVLKVLLFNKILIF